eukprot:scaffold278429_cov32-Tisochrysis_lutea.AAC.1
MECRHCAYTLQFRGGQTTCLLEPVTSATRKQKLYVSNEALRAVLGCLLSGSRYRSFAMQAVAQQMEPTKHGAFESYVARVAPMCEA